MVLHFEFAAQWYMLLAHHISVGLPDRAAHRRTHCVPDDIPDG